MPRPVFAWYVKYDFTDCTGQPASFVNENYRTKKVAKQSAEDAARTGTHNVVTYGRNADRAAGIGGVVVDCPGAGVVGMGLRTTTLTTQTRA
jgi:hypothetical protein